MMNHINRKSPIMEKEKIYAGIDNDEYGGMTPTGNMGVRDYTGKPDMRRLEPESHTRTL